MDTYTVTATLSDGKEYSIEVPAHRWPTLTAFSDYIFGNTDAIPPRVMAVNENEIFKTSAIIRIRMHNDRSRTDKR